MDNLLDRLFLLGDSRNYFRGEAVSHRVLVCGGRDFNDASFIFDCLDLLNEHEGVGLIISGSARGADIIGEMWARARSVPVLRFPAQWNAQGKAVGPIRNLKMLVEGKPDLVVAFKGGRGTANMISQAQTAGVEVRQQRN